MPAPPETGIGLGSIVAALLGSGALLKALDIYAGKQATAEKERSEALRSATDLRDELRKDIDTLKGDLTNLKKEVADLRTERDECEDKYKQLSGEHIILSAKNKVLENRCKELTDDLAILMTYYKDDPQLTRKLSPGSLFALNMKNS